jgi:hypothetical protein
MAHAIVLVPRAAGVLTGYLITGRHSVLPFSVFVWSIVDILIDRFTFRVCHLVESVDSARM